MREKLFNPWPQHKNAILLRKPVEVNWVLVQSARLWVFPHYKENLTLDHPRKPFEFCTFILLLFGFQAAECHLSVVMTILSNANSCYKMLIEPLQVLGAELCVQGLKKKNLIQILLNSTSLTVRNQILQHFEKSFLMQIK